MWCWLIHELTMNVGFTICLVFTRSILITPYFIYIYIYIYIKSFNLWYVMSTHGDSFLLSNQCTIDFWSKEGLNSRYLI